MESDMEPTLSRRERKKLETRQSLRESALVLFHEKGFDGTTVEEITERADVAKGTFFNYFSSKEVLLRDLVAWQFAKLCEALDVEKGAPESPIARLKLLTKLLHELTVSDWHLFQRAYASRFSGPPGPHEAKRRLTSLASDLVREAQACGQIRSDVEPEMVSHLLFAAHFRHLKISFHKGETFPPEDDSEHVIDLLMNGLAGPNWRKT
jgi:AcrR family transcriptional regulator